MESLPLPTPNLKSVPDLSSSDASVVVVAISEEGGLQGSLPEQGSIERLVTEGQVRGKRGEINVIAASAESGPSTVVAIGVGSPDQASRQLAYQTASTAVRKLIDRPRKSIAIALAGAFDASLHDAIVAGCLVACEGQGIYQSEGGLDVPDQFEFVGIDQSAIDRGQAIGQSINHTRRLVNEPPAVIYPESFADRAAELAKSVGLEAEIWDEERLVKEGCRAMLAVGAGSTRPPRLLILRHNGGGNEAPLALVGKGVTFDSGGLSLKPSASMTDMKCDMAGAATVVGVMHAMAKLGIKKNVLGFCGLAENMVSGDSYKLGDVIETRSGKTIEILNTDAEGRVVLADTLDVAIQHQPAAMVDLATLTGACLVALGMEVAGLMTNDQALCDEVEAAANQVGEPVWQLPMFKLYDEKIKSSIADIKNIGEGRWGGAITAAKFLENFVGETPWVHIDIAGPAFADGPKPHRDGGATGALVQTLIEWIESRK